MKAWPARAHRCSARWPGQHYGQARGPRAPASGIPNSAEPLTPLPPKRREGGYFPASGLPSSLPRSTGQKPVIPARSRASRQELLNRFVQDFAAEDATPAEDLAATLAAGLVRPADAKESTPTPHHDWPKWWGDYDLLEETVDTLRSLLPAPQPASTTWPTRWQGNGIFDHDVQRLANLADCLHRQGKHVPPDLVEAALEMIGVQLRTERMPATELPAARTGWRDSPTRSEADGIAGVTANCLSTLMSSAFDAGFDRRALSTRLRILASATASAQRGNGDATMAYANALIRFTGEYPF